MYLDFLVEAFSHPVWPEPDLHLDVGVWGDHPLGGHVGEGRARVGIKDTLPYFLQVKTDIEITYVLDLDCFLGVLLEEDTA